MTGFETLISEALCFGERHAGGHTVVGFEVSHDYALLSPLPVLT